MGPGFGLSLIVATLLPVILCLVVRWLAASSEPAWLAVFAWILILNAASHIGVSLATWSLMPGVLTATLLLIPAAVYALAVLPRQVWSGRTIILAAAIMLAATAFSLALGAVAARTV